MEKIFIKHRLNRIQDLQSLTTGVGAEIDLRTDVHAPGKIILAHDPWHQGDDFDSWLKIYSDNHREDYLILNTKEDQLEDRATELLEKHGIKNYFFLDTTVPTLVKWSKKGPGQPFAVRVSSVEPATNAQNFKGSVQWVWVDCFNGVPLPVAEITPLKNTFRLCLVSPELQGLPTSSISAFQELASQCDAICTKAPEEWQKIIV